MKIYILLCAYDVCTVSPPFQKEGQGWFVWFTELTSKQAGRRFRAFLRLFILIKSVEKSPAVALPQMRRQS